MSQTPEYLYSELPAIELFKKLGFNYFDASISDTRESINEVILEDRLRQSLLKINPWLRDNTLEKVVLTFWGIIQLNATPASLNQRQSLLMFFG